MKNREKYAEEIKNYRGNEFCKDFIKPVILKKDCSEFSNCSQCRLIQQLWLDEEYKEPEVDWSKVPVDTLIRVRNGKDYLFELRYFSRYENEKIYAWSNGTKSKTSTGNDCPWNYAEIVNEE